MAYEEQIFANLGTVQNPDASQSTQFVGDGQPFVIDEQTNRLFNQITQQQIAKREKEVADWEKGMSEALTTASKVPENLYGKDIDLFREEQKKLISEIYKNPEIFAGQNPKKEQEFTQKLADLTTLAKKSENRGKTIQKYRELMARNPDYDNKLMRDGIQKLEESDINESQNFIFTPIANPTKDFIEKTLPAWQKTTDGELINDIQVSPNDANVDIYRTKKKFNFNSFLPIFKSQMGGYLAMEYNATPELKNSELYPTADDYIEAQAKNIFEEEKYIGNPVYKRNEEKALDAKIADREDRQEQQITIEGIKFENRQAVKDHASKSYPTIEELYNQYDIISTPDPSKKITITPENKKIIKTQLGVEIDGDFYDVTETVREQPKYADIVEGSQKLFMKVDKKGNKTFYESSDGTKGVNWKEPLTKERLIQLQAGEKNEKDLDAYNKFISEANKPESTSGGGLKGIDEMAYNPMGRGYDKGNLKEGMKWDNHDDHIHYGFTDPQVAIATIKKAKELGLNTTQNPYTGKVDKVHTDGSFHYANFDGEFDGKKLGKGLDVSGDAKKMKQLFEWVENTYGNNQSTTTQTKSSKGLKKLNW
jgi:hypothetical protein